MQYVIYGGIALVVVVLVMVIIANLGKSKNPCENCEVFLDPNGDPSHCWRCEVNKR